MSPVAIALLASALLSASPAQGDCMPRWMEELWPDPKSVAFRPTSLDERAAFASLVPELLCRAEAGGAPPPELVSLARSAGFALEAREHGGERFWVLREEASNRHGAGAYVFRTGKTTEDVLQAPHVYFDQGTGEIAARLFLCAPAAQRPRVMMTNTAHRYRSRPDETRADRDHPADVAHNPEHLFQGVTDALARALPHLRVIQLHGFGPGEGEGEGGRTVSAVISSGARVPTSWVRQVSAKLVPVLGQGVRLYPSGGRALGGTTNAQARLLQAYPGARFLHLELSADSRRELSSPERLEQLAEVLFAPEEG